MGQTESRDVLIVLGDATRADGLQRALVHPALRLQLARNEQEILGAFRGRRYALALIAGNLGRRPPLVAGEAVRLRQEGLHVLITVGDETAPEDLAAHRARRLDGVSYVELADPRRRANVDELDILMRIRAALLDHLGVAEDDTSRAAWLEGERTLAEQAAAAAIEPVRAVVTDAALDVSTIEVTDAPSAPVTPAIQAAPLDLTQEDVAFAARLVEPARAVDVRQPLPQTKPTEGTGAERTVQLLREKLREHERNLARMAQIYAARLASFDRADGQLEEALTARQSLEHDLERLREHVNQERERGRSERGDKDQQLNALQKERDQMDARVAELRQDAERQRADAEHREQARQEQEHRFAAMLTQAQEAFTALREQSTRALADYERQLIERGSNLEREQASRAEAFEHSRKLESELAHAAESLAKLEQEQQELRRAAEQERINARAEQATATETLLREQAALQARLGELQQELQHERSSMLELRHQAESPISEIERLREALAAAEARLTQEQLSAEAAVRQHEEQWLARFEGVKQSVLALKGSHDTSRASLREREQQLTVAQTQLTSRDDEVQQLQKAHREVTEALARERVGFAEALDAKLDALERFARETSERMVRLVEALAQLDQVARRQEVLTERLLKRTPIGSLPPGSNGVLTVSVDRETGREPFKPGRRLWIGIGAGALALVLVVALLWPSSPTVPSPAAPAAPADTGAAPSTEQPAEPTDAPHAAEAAQPDEAPSPTPAAAAPEPPLVAKGGPVPDKKELRRELFAASKAKRWAQAVTAGTTLREAHGLDWEAEYTLARAQEKSGNALEAASSYLHFAEANARNKHAETALVAAAKLLAAQGDKARARAVYEKIVASSKGGVRSDAQRALKQLGGR
ncbi:MAG: hypothetical protein AAB426_02090 [Myxococcota bacterium]